MLLPNVDFYREAEYFLQNQGDLAEKQYQHLTCGKGVDFYDTSPLPAEERDRLQEEAAPHHNAMLVVQDHYWMLGAQLAMREHQNPQGSLTELLEGIPELKRLLSSTTEDMAQALMAQTRLPIPEHGVANPYFTSIYLRAADQLGTFVVVGYSFARALLGKLFPIYDDLTLLTVYAAFIPPTR